MARQSTTAKITRKLAHIIGLYCDTVNHTEEMGGVIVRHRGREVAVVKVFKSPTGIMGRTDDNGYVKLTECTVLKSTIDTLVTDLMGGRDITTELGGRYFESRDMANIIAEPLLKYWHLVDAFGISYSFAIRCRYGYFHHVFNGRLPFGGKPSGRQVLAS